MCSCIVRQRVSSGTFLAKQFFDFHTSKLEHTLIMPATIVSITLQRDSGLLAATCDDLVVRLVDIETHRIVREFGGFGGRILDVVGLPLWLIVLVSSL